MDQIEIPEDHPIRASDRYGPGGRLLRRWSLNAEGYPACVEDALDTEAAAPEETAAIEAANAAIRFALSVPAPPHEAVSLAAYRAAIMAHVDSTAGQRGYDNAASCAGYVNSTVSAWAAEAATFVAWRDAVWLAAFETLAEVQGGAAPPSIAELIAGLPVIAWPT